MFKSHPKADELIKYYKETFDEDFITEMFEEEDMCYAQMSWACLMYDEQYEIMDKMAADFPDFFAGHHKAHIHEVP